MYCFPGLLKISFVFSHASKCVEYPTNPKEVSTALPSGYTLSVKCYENLPWILSMKSCSALQQWRCALCSGTPPCSWSTSFIGWWIVCAAQSHNRTLSEVLNNKVLYHYTWLLCFVILFGGAQKPNSNSVLFQLCIFQLVSVLLLPSSKLKKNKIWVGFLCTTE